MGKQAFLIQIPRIEYLGQSPVDFQLRDKAKVPFREFVPISPPLWKTLTTSFSILKISLCRACKIEVIFLDVASPDLSRLVPLENPVLWLL